MIFESILAAALVAYIQEIEASKRMSKEQKTNVLLALIKAFNETEGYYAYLADNHGNNKDIHREHHIAELWDNLSVLMMPFNASLADRVSLKAQFWRDGAIWSDSEITLAKIELSSIRSDGFLSLE